MREGWRDLGCRDLRESLDVQSRLSFGNEKNKEALKDVVELLVLSPRTVTAHCCKAIPYSSL